MKQQLMVKLHFSSKKKRKVEESENFTHEHDLSTFFFGYHFVYKQWQMLMSNHGSKLDKKSHKVPYNPLLWCFDQSHPLMGTMSTCSDENFRRLIFFDGFSVASNEYMSRRCILMSQTMEDCKRPSRATC